jgi:Virulence-associated protein E/Bifunctional DNA primase/polymerase, N-terminal
MATVLEIRQALIDHGYTPIPLYGKAPPAYGKNNKRKGLADWQQLHDVTHEQIVMWGKTWPDAGNTGALTALMPALDIDILDPDAVRAIVEHVREKFEERGYVPARTGLAPKTALVFRTLEPFAKITVNLIAPNGDTSQKIELLANGQQVVVDGIHPDTKRPYTWQGGSVLEIPRDDLAYISAEEAQELVEEVVSTILIRDFGYTRATAARPGKGNGAQPGIPAQEWKHLVDSILAGHALHESTRDLAAKLARSGMADGATVNFLRSLMDSSAAPHDERWQARYDNLPRQVDSIRAKIEREEAAVAAALVPVIAPAIRPGSGAPPPPPPPPGTGASPAASLGPSPGSTPGPAPARRSYMKGRSSWACNTGNVLLALKQDPDLVGAFSYDEMLCCEILRRPLFKPDPSFTPRPVTDVDALAVQEHLQWLGFRRLGKLTTHDAINKHAREHAFHPVRDYLDRLAWDDEPRLGTWLAKCFGATQTKYTEEVGKMFLISMVARIYKPGCKVDYMLILEGEQGELKSQACAILAGEYFSDQLPDVTTKDAFQHLRGKWLIEVAEMHTYSRAAVDHFKAFLTRQVERYRPAFGHKEVHEPRQNVFIGTTNKARYLRDATGNRRFWPLKTGEVVDLDWLRANRDQLFAEAVALYRQGAHWWPNREFERQTIREEQEARYETDAWEEPIMLYLDGLPAPKKTTILDIATNALGYELNPPIVTPYQPHPVRGTPVNRLSPGDQQRITAVLIHLRWTPRRIMTSRWWEPI